MVAPHLDPELENFYISLLRSEARHFEDYLSLAQLISKDDISQRITLFGEHETQLILDKDADFKFHSGAPKIFSEAVS